MTRQISIRLSDQELEMLAHIQQQASRSQALRVLIRRAFWRDTFRQGTFYAMGSQSPVHLEVKDDA